MGSPCNLRNEFKKKKHGEVLGTFTKCRIPDPANRANRIVTHEWVVTTGQEYIQTDHNGYEFHFVDEGDSGSVLVSRDATDNISPVMGLVFAAFTRQQVADIACFTPSDRLVGALHALTSQYLVPYHPDVPGSEVKHLNMPELKLQDHTQSISSEITTVENEPEAQSLEEMRDPPDIDFTAPMYNMYVEL